MSPWNNISMIKCGINASNRPDAPFPSAAAGLLTWSSWLPLRPLCFFLLSAGMHSAAQEMHRNVIMRHEIVSDVNVY